MPADERPRADPSWDVGWDARRRQLDASLAATPAQRLQWLEEMIAFAHQTGALPRPRPEGEAGSG